MSSLYAFFLLLLTLLLPLFAQAKVYTGHLDQQAITMEIDILDDEVYGRYFYLGKYQDIPVHGTHSETKILLEEGAFYEANPSNRKFDLNILTDNTLEGESTDNQTGITQKIQLRALEPTLLSHPSTQRPYLNALSTSSYYDYLRINELTFNLQEKELFMGFTVQWFQEPHSQLRSFRIESDAPSNPWQKVNRQIETHFWIAVNEMLSCSYYDEYERSTLPRYISESVVSMSDAGSYFCGGAHPAVFHNGINFSVATGDILSLQEYIGLPAHQPLAPWLFMTMLQLHPEAMQNENCDYLQEEAWDIETNSWLITTQGVEIYPYFPYVYKMCSMTDWAVLPKQEFPKNSSPKTPL